MVGVSARQIKSEGCPNDEIFVKLLNLIIMFCRKVVRRMVLGKLSNNSRRRGPGIVLESYPTNSPRMIVQRIYLYRRVDQNLKQIFLF